MQNNGLIRLFAILFGFVSIYQLSFTFIASQKEAEAKEFAISKYSRDVTDYINLRDRASNDYLDSIGSLSSNPLQKKDRFEGETLFLCGGKSGYVRSEHHTSIRDYFPAAEMITLPNAGHDVHVEDREGFMAHLHNFLQGGN